MFKIFDIAVYGVIAGFIFAVFLGINGEENKKPEKIEIHINNKLAYIYKITKERKEYKIMSNGGAAVIVCENYEVWENSAPCRNKLCIKQGKIKESGQMIVCIPEKMVVKLTGGTDDIDGIIR